MNQASYEMIDEQIRSLKCVLSLPRNAAMFQTVSDNALLYKFDTLL